MYDERYCILERRGEGTESLFFETSDEKFAIKLMDQLKKEAYQRKDHVEYRMIPVEANLLKIAKSKPETTTKKARILKLDIPGIGEVELQRDEE